MTHEIKVTWVEVGSSNAACVGHDETVTIEAETVESALKEAVDGHQYSHEADWNTGKYGIVAENVNGTETFMAEPESN